jgi:hypothetical protein
VGWSMTLKLGKAQSSVACTMIIRLHHDQFEGPRRLSMVSRNQSPLHWYSYPAGGS